MNSKRSKSVVKAQHEIMNMVESRQQREQRSTKAVEAPWRFVRDPAKLLLRLLRSCCALHTLVAIKALQLRLCDSIIYE